MSILKQRVREQLHKIGLVLLEDGNGWLVTNNGTTKYLFEKRFEDVSGVLMWLESPVRRLADEEADEFDKDWASFVNQCDGCRRGLFLDDAGIHHGETLTDMIACTKERY